MSPLSALLWLLAAGAGFAYWNAARAAAERAGELGRNACQAAGVIWLDQSVHAIGLRPCRLPNGWLGFERTFRFDYSHDGIERHSGRMVLRGRELVSFIGPASATRVSTLRQSTEEAEDL